MSVVHFAAASCQACALRYTLFCRRCVDVLDLQKKTATVNGKVVAESDDCIYFDNQWYFPPSSVKSGALRANGQAGHCGWKGKYDYFDVIADGDVAAGSAWIYPEPMVRVFRLFTSDRLPCTNPDPSRLPLWTSRGVLVSGRA